MNEHFFHAEGIAAALAILAFVGGALAGLYKLVKKVDDTLTFVEQVRSNHLPHIYRVLGQIAHHLGIPPEDEEERPQS